MTAYRDPVRDRWRFRFRFRNKRYSGSTPSGANTRRMAQKLERDMLDKLAARTFTGAMPTVATFAVRYLEHQSPPRVKPLTAELHKNVVTVHIVPHIGTLPVDDIRKETLAMLVSTWSKTAKPRTVNQRLGIVARMLALAMEWDYLAAIPRIKGLKVPKSTPRFLTFEEAAALVKAAKPNWRTMIFVAVRTGLRIGELRGLQWADVDLANGAIHVRRTDPGRRDMVAGAPKSNEERTVPLTPDALDTLKTMHTRAQPKPRDHVWPALLWRGKRHTGARSGTGCKHGIEVAAKRAKLTEVTWHTLRHTYASWLVMRGTPMRVIQRLLGHASVKQSEVYAHLAPDFALHDAVSVLDYAIGPSERKLLTNG